MQLSLFGYHRYCSILIMDILILSLHFGVISTKLSKIQSRSTFNPYHFIIIQNRGNLAANTCGFMSAETVSHSKIFQSTAHSTKYFQDMIAECWLLYITAFQITCAMSHYFRDMYGIPPYSCDRHVVFWCTNCWTLCAWSFWVIICVLWAEEDQFMLGMLTLCLLSIHTLTIPMHVQELKPHIEESVHWLA